MWRSLTNMTRDTETPSKDRNRRITHKEVAKENRTQASGVGRLKVARELPVRAALLTCKAKLSG